MRVTSRLRELLTGSELVVAPGAYDGLSARLMATHDWFDFVKNDPPLLHGIIKTDRLIVFGGGYPITTDAGISGVSGVSGGHYTHDMEVAQAGLAVL
jgi:uncharacterized protein GlcG (DUF336 family)